MELGHNQSGGCKVRCTSSAGDLDCKYIHVIGERAKRARHYQGCTNSSLCGIYVYVIARVGVKFGINFTSVRLSGNKIARGEAECYLPLNLTRVKFVPNFHD